jgi:phasin family protein
METMDTHEAKIALAMKQQFEQGFAVLEAITEGSRKLQEAQLKAATEAHAAVEAIHKRLAESKDGQELQRLQSEWMSVSLEKSLAYWRQLYATAIETESSIARLLAQQLSVSVPSIPLVPGAGGGDQGPLVEMMSSAYSRWIDAMRQFYQAPGSPSRESGNRRQKTG